MSAKRVVGRMTVYDNSFWFDSYADDPQVGELVEIYRGNGMREGELVEIGTVAAVHPEWGVSQINTQYWGDFAPDFAPPARAPRHAGGRV